MSKQYVQHVSGQGEKWPVYRDNGETWLIWGHSFVLPKSEYRLCEPDKWENVTMECTLGPCDNVLQHKGFVVGWDRGYRLRKVISSCKMGEKGWVLGESFIIEKKVTA